MHTDHGRTSVPLGRDRAPSRGASIARVAHLSDVHLLDRRVTGARASHDLRVRLLSFGRPLDAAARRRKLLVSLRRALRCGADHIVMSGDLTESGTDAEFEALGAALDEALVPPDRLTLVPGNHDLYTHPDAWRRALEGPLRLYRNAAAGAPGKIVERGEVVLVPADVTCHQPIARSSGRLTADALEQVRRRLEDPAIRERTAILIQHHPPYAHASRAWQWVDGLDGAADLTSLLARFPNVSVLHGHLHKVVDHAIGGGRARVFGAPALVEDDEDAPRVRLYEVRDGLLESVGLAA